MAQQIIDNGAFLDDPQAEAVRDAFTKTNNNFTELYNAINGGGYIEYFLNLNGIDTTQSELSYIAEAINRGQNYDVNGNNGQPFTKASGQEFIFKTIVFVGGDQANPRYLHRYYRCYRTSNSIGGNTLLPITNDEVSPAGSLEINPETNQDLFINLGDIGTSEVWDVFNQGQPNGDGWLINGVVFVIAIQNGIEKTWRFIGGNGIWGGADLGIDPDVLEADANDFDLLSTELTVDFQETLPATITTASINEVNLSNHEGNIIPTVSNITHYKVTNPMLYGFAILNINTATKPTIETPTVINAGSFIVGKEYTIKTIGTTDFTIIGASSNTVGTVFKATGAGTGDGDAYLNAEQFRGDAFIPNKDIKLKIWDSGNGILYKFLTKEVKAPTETLDTGVTIDMSNMLGNYCNMSTANTNENITLVNEVLGGGALIKGNWINEPTFTHATLGASVKIAGASFASATDMYVAIWYNGVRFEHKYIEI